MYVGDWVMMVIVIDEYFGYQNRNINDCDVQQVYQYKGIVVVFIGYVGEFLDIVEVNGGIGCSEDEC